MILLNGKTILMKHNAGTTEHVEPYRSQYTAFQIAHICCRHGGLMIHGVPSIELRERSGTWKRHCHYYYSEEFWRNLAKWNGYDIIHLELTTSWTAVYRKQKTSEWKIPKEVLLSEVHIRNEDIDFNDTNYSHQRNSLRDDKSLLSLMKILRFYRNNSCLGFWINKKKR